MGDFLASRSNGGQLLKHDAEKKSKTYYHQDPVTGATTIEEVSDVTEIIEDNKAQYNRHDERSKWRHDGGQNHVARIPEDVYYDLEFQKIVKNNDIKALKRFLNDYNNRAFRTRPGRI